MIIIVGEANAVNFSSCAEQSFENTTCAQVFADVNVTLLDVLERSVVEQHFHATETFGADRDDVSVWELVGLILVGTFRGRFELCVAVKRHVAKVLFDITTDNPLCGGRERVPALSEELVR